MDTTHVVIAIVGKKRSGKDSAGAFLRDLYDIQPAQKLAGPIKQIARMLFGWSEDMVEGCNYDRERQIPELGMSVRQFLQECGSLFKYNLSTILPGYGEKVGTRVWAKILVRWLLSQKTGMFSVTDVRFPEEVAELRENFKHTYVVKLVSDRSPDDTHISETSVDLIDVDYTIVNNGWDSYGILYRGLNDVMNSITSKLQEE